MNNKSLGMANIRVSAMDDLDSKEDTNTNAAKSLNAGTPKGQVTKGPEILISKASEEKT